jgi:hypothetical protein
MDTDFAAEHATSVFISEAENWDPATILKIRELRRQQLEHSPQWQCENASYVNVLFS